MIQYFAYRECFWKKCSKRYGYKAKTLFQLRHSEKLYFLSNKRRFSGFYSLIYAREDVGRIMQLLRSYIFVYFAETRKLLIAYKLVLIDEN